MEKALLVVTQVVDLDSPNLGFFHRWLEELEKVQRLFVISNSLGYHDLDPNTRVLSLGKERTHPRILRFLKYQYNLIRFLPRVDTILFHMCPEFVIGAGFWPRLFRTTSILWYTHKHVGWRLRFAEKIVDKIFTASAKSFRLPSQKVQVTGHGIDLERFKPIKNRIRGKAIQVISAGRITPAKKTDLLIEVAEILKNESVDFQMRIAGKPILPSDESFFDQIKAKVREAGLQDLVSFIGPIPHRDIHKFFQDGDVFVNLSETGSVDKAVLESAACGTPVVTSNEAFLPLDPPIYSTTPAPEAIYKKILVAVSEDRSDALRELICQNHDLVGLVRKISDSTRFHA